jgi:hypothetical protein
MPKGGLTGFMRVLLTPYFHCALPRYLKDGWDVRPRNMSVVVLASSSPDLTPYDLLLCGYMQDAVLVPPLPTVTPGVKSIISEILGFNFRRHPDIFLRNSGVRDRRLPCGSWSTQRLPVKSVRNLTRFLINLYVLYENYYMDNLLSVNILKMLPQFEFYVLVGYTSRTFIPLVSTKFH